MERPAFGAYNCPRRRSQGARSIQNRERHMATIAVMGASGNIGGRISEQLLAGGHKVRALGRSPEKLAGLKAKGAEVLIGDAADARVPDHGLHRRRRRVHAAAPQPGLARLPGRARPGRRGHRPGDRDERRAPRRRAQQRRWRTRVRPRSDRRPASTGGATVTPQRRQCPRAASGLLLRELPSLARSDPAPGHQRQRRGGHDQHPDDRNPGHRGVRRPGPRRTRLDRLQGPGTARSRAT